MNTSLNYYWITLRPLVIKILLGLAAIVALFYAYALYQSTDRTATSDAPIEVITVDFPEDWAEVAFYGQVYFLADATTTPQALYTYDVISTSTTQLLPGNFYAFDRTDRYDGFAYLTDQDDTRVLVYDTRFDTDTRAAARPEGETTERIVTTVQPDAYDLSVAPESSLAAVTASDGITIYRATGEPVTNIPNSYAPTWYSSSTLLYLTDTQLIAYDARSNTQEALFLSEFDANARIAVSPNQFTIAVSNPIFGEVLLFDAGALDPLSYVSFIRAQDVLENGTDIVFDAESRLYTLMTPDDVTGDIFMVVYDVENDLPFGWGTIPNLPTQNLQLIDWSANQMRPEEFVTREVVPTLDVE